MKENHDFRWAGIAGVGSLVVAIIGRLVLGNLPRITDTPMTIAAYLAQYRSQVLMAALLFAIATVLFLWFGVGLSHAFRRADETSDLPALVMAGYILVSAIGFMGISVFAGMTYAVSVHRPLLLIAAGPYTALVVVGAITGVAVAATFAVTGWAIMRGHVLPMWMGWCAMVVAAVRLLAAFAVGSTGGVLAPDSPVIAIIAGVLTALWVLAASWLLIREQLEIPAGGARPAMGGPAMGGT
ncbi:hypothetical protein [Nonomuraea sediminis]|uniref:hypothetical protein n=1 Tax=Nonomuraea sediminis TaxID=2835864 RepID=UPI001BDD2A1D|nr:hypothetical protein [Nonomuraea sediminis]